jgi:hypothetical protein
MLGKRLINSNSAAAGGSCTTDTLQILGDTSCIAYYKMSDATDESGNFDGTPTSVNFNVAGKFGNAAQFNGSSSNVEFSAGSFNNTTITISAWINSASNAADQSIFNSFDYDGSTSRGFIWKKNANQTLTAQFYNSGTQSNLNTTATVANNVWTNVVLTISTTQANIYINDGTAVTLTQNNLINFHSTTKAGIGSYRFTGGSFQQFFDGSIDNVRIFNKTLSSSEVTTLYNEVYCVPTIVPTDYFNTLIWDGNNTSNRLISGLNFQSDFVWAKQRSPNATDHIIADSVRGGTGTGPNATNLNLIYPYGTFPQDANVGNSFISSIENNGFKIGTSTYVNSTNSKYVAWCIRAGGASVQNNDGTIQGANCLVSANKEAGFSIVKYTGGGGIATVGHGLDSAPQMYIVKSMGHSASWYTYHIGLDETSPEDYNVRLNESSARQDSLSYWNDTAPTDSVFTIGTTTGVSKSSTDFITYCFHSVDGMSRVGSYVGSDSTQLIVTNFRPAFVLIKTTSDEWWNIVDNKRNGTLTSRLYANSLVVEGSFTNDVILNSNGFTVLGNNSSLNDAGRDFIFLAIAEEVFNPSGLTRNATNPFGDASEVALYKFEDNANDAEGNYNGTWSGTEAYATGYIDKAAIFNSSSSKITLPQTYGAEGEQFSYSLWFNTSTADGSYMFNKRNGNNTFNIRIDNSFSPAGKICVNNWAGTGQSANNAQSTAGGYNDNAWHHFVFTYDGSQTTKTKCFIDGVYDSGMDWTYNLATQSVSNGNCIGNFDGSGSNFSGKLDQVRIFNRALDSGEALQLYNE